MYNNDMPSRAELPSAGKLLRSTIIAALVAAALLITTVLPGEYGIDPTGVGRMLGLTPMGEIKTQLAEEASAEAIAPSTSAPAAVVQPPVAEAPVRSVTPPESAPVQALGAEVEQSTVRSDTVTFKLAPNAAAEIKLVMKERAQVDYEWSSAGGAVNYDTHGDPFGAARDFYHGYGKGRNQLSDTGMLEAAFDGKHGWFWRNRSGKEVTVTLKVRGDYEKVERVI